MGLARDREHDEGDEGHARHAVGLEAVGARSDRVARVVARAVGDHAGVAGVVFFDVEDDLHQIGADVGDLGEDAAGNTQSGSAEGFTDGEADEALARHVFGDPEQNGEHDHQLHADEQHSNAHSRLEGN